MSESNKMDCILGIAMNFSGALLLFIYLCNKQTCAVRDVTEMKYVLVFAVARWVSFRSL